MPSIHKAPSRRAYQWIITVALCLALLACGGGASDSSDTSPGTGSFNFSLTWENPNNVRYTQASENIDVCRDYMIETLKITVRTLNSDSFSTEQVWNCDEHGGAIVDVPAGVKLTLDATALAGDSEEWNGEVVGFTIAAGPDNPTKEIILKYEGADHSPPQINPILTPSSTDMVPNNTQIEFTFTERVAPSSVNSTTVTLVEDGVADSSIDCNISYDGAAPYAVIVKPTAYLKPNTAYTLTFSKGIKDSHANNMAEPYTWNFTTGDWVYFEDKDGDGYGDPKVSLDSPHDGYILDNTDCDDTSEFIHPGADEICNGLDDNCSGDAADGEPQLTLYTDTDAFAFTCEKAVFEWEAVPDAKSYELLISSSNDMSDPTSYTTRETSLAPERLDSSGTYYWQLRYTDAQEDRSCKSEINTLEIGSTNILKDILPGNPEGYSDPSELTEVNGMLYFSADDGIHGKELWQSDGTSDGTHMVVDINGTSAGSYPSDIVAFKEKIYFSARENDDSDRLWVYDGSSATMIDWHHGYSIFSPHSLTVVGDRLYFIASSGSSEYELWRFDGDYIESISSISPEDLTAVEGTLYYTDKDTSGDRELYMHTAGDTYTPTKIDINPSGSSSPTYLTPVGSDLYFFADNGTNGEQLYRFDGTKTTQITNIEATPEGFLHSLIESGGTLFFIYSPIYYEDYLYKYDGSVVTPMDIEHEALSSPYEFYISPLSVHGDTMYILVRSNYFLGYELRLMVVNVNNSDIKAITVLNGLDYDYSFTHHVDGNGKIYIFEEEFEKSYKIWESDGTEANTVSIASVSNYTGGAGDMQFFGNALYYTHYDPWYGIEIWKHCTD